MQKVIKKRNNDFGVPFWRILSADGYHGQAFRLPGEDLGLQGPIFEPNEHRKVLFGDPFRRALFCSFFWICFRSLFSEGFRTFFFVFMILGSFWGPCQDHFRDFSGEFSDTSNTETQGLRFIEPSFLGLSCTFYKMNFGTQCLSICSDLGVLWGSISGP